MWKDYLAKQITRKPESVFLFMLKQGLQMVSKVKTLDAEGRIAILEKPFLVQMIGQGGNITVGLIPFLSFNKKAEPAEKVALDAGEILALRVLDSEDDIYSLYIKSTSGIAISTKPSEADIIAKNLSVIRGGQNG